MPEARPSKWLISWVLLWGILSVVHVTQAIWASGGAARPGDLEDGRLNALILEHGYQAIIGTYPWDSPGQFYPSPGTLGMTDTHLGTLPLYAVLRAVGLTADSACQGWFILVAAMNALAMQRLLRSLRIHAGIQGPLIFASVASTSLVWATGTHTQLLPIFPLLFFWRAIVRWLQDRRWWYALAAMGWWAWQFAAGPYQAFFSAVMGLGFAVIGLALIRTRGTDPGQTQNTATISWQSRVWIGLVALCGLTLGGAAVVAHFASVQSGHSREILEIVRGVPDWRSWMTPAPVSWLYSGGWPGRHPDVVEHIGFPGFTLLAAVLCTLIWGWRWRRETPIRWALVFSLTVVAVAAVFTRWPVSDATPWILLAKKLPMLCAFRASCRITMLTQVVAAVILGLLLTRMWYHHRGAWPRTLVLACALLAAGENLAQHQPAISLAELRTRREALIAAWRQAGDRPVLAYAPSYTNQTVTVVNLEAWDAAMHLKRVTINGYNGGVPGSFMTFLFNPTPAQARELYRRYGVPDEQVSIVEALPPAVEARFGIRHLDQRELGHLQNFDIQPFRWSLSYDAVPFVVEGRTMYQLTPPSEMHFLLPDDARHLDVEIAMRPGSYGDAGNGSDGVGYSWIVRQANGSECLLAYEFIDPQNHKEHRGVLARNWALPTGSGRVLIVRTDTGPANNPAWDWPLVGNLHVR